MALKKKGIAKVNMTKKEFHVEYQDKEGLWHLRFNHLGFTRLNLLSRSNMVNVLHQIRHPSQLCECYMKGRQNRRSFEVGKSKRSTKLQLVHTGIVDQIETKSLGVQSYFNTSIDKLCRKIRVDFLKKS